MIQSTSLDAPQQTPLLAHGRPCRVVVLIITIVLLSLADLYITLAYLHSGGMGEANPVARWIIGHGSPALLVFWKLATVSVAATIFLYARRTRAAEVGAWGCVFLLTWLTLRWGAYSDEVRNMTPTMQHLAEHDHSRWVTMTPTP